MQIRPIQSQSFKGYDACPIKRLYMQGIEYENQKDIFDEVREIGEIEGIDVLVFNNPGFTREVKEFCPTYHPWTQDDKSFVQDKGRTKMVIVETLDALESMALGNFLDDLGYKNEHNKTFLVGGNSFIGKKKDGEKYILIGKNEFDANVLREVSKDYDVKFNNIYTISQPNFHIDMALRPIGHPYILVNDEDIVKQKTKKYGRKLYHLTKKFYKEHYKPEGNEEKYATPDQTVKELKRRGFIPIRIGGVYTSGINYMNAIVNKHPDGTITYITNSARNSEFPELDYIFERELRQKVPNIKDVYFVSGKRSINNPKMNTMMSYLANKNGGIHCMTLEEPNFEAWG